MLNKVSIENIVLSNSRETESYKVILQYVIWQFMKGLHEMNPNHEIVDGAGKIMDKIAYKKFQTYFDTYIYKLPRFRYTDIGNYVVENDRSIKEKYVDFDARTPKSYRVNATKNYVMRRIEQLIELGLIEKNKMVKSEKNNSRTPLYSFTREGCYLAWFIHARTVKIDDSDRRRAAQMVFLFMTYGLAPSLSVMGDFIKQFLIKCLDKEIFLKFILDGHPLFLQIFPIYKNFRAVRQYLSRSVFVEPKVGRIFLEVLNELDPDDRKLILLQFKLDIESAYEQVIPKEWDIMRYNNIQDHTKITLMGLCENCHSGYPFQMDVYEFLGIPYTAKLNRDLRFDYDSFHKIKCMKCGNPDCFTVIPYWRSQENVRGVIGFPSEQLQTMMKQKAKLDE